MAQHREQASSPDCAGPAPTSEERLTQAGLDPALAAALLQQNPLAVQAVAGLVDNSLIAAALGLDRQTPTLEPETPTPSCDGAIAAGQPGLEEPAPDRPGQGSGEHGRLDPTAADHANKRFWRHVANGALAAGMPNASAHMHHYLDNTGAEKEVDLDAIERDVPSFGLNLDQIQGEVLADAHFNLSGFEGTQQIHWGVSNWRHGQAFARAESEDWYFAVAGNDQGLEATAWFTPAGDSSNGLLEIEGRWHVRDVYDWDEGKSTTILAVEVDDKALGRLHEVGLAQEFRIFGSRPFALAMEITAGMDPLRSAKQAPEAQDPEREE